MTFPPQVIKAITAIVGRSGVRLAASELDTYASDGLPTHRSRPGAVVLPGSRDEVVKLLQVLSHHRIPFVARGAGTGLSGGALANRDAVSIVLTRLNRILEIDPDSRLAVVEPGVVERPALRSGGAVRPALRACQPSRSSTRQVAGGQVTDRIPTGNARCNQDESWTERSGRTERYKDGT